MLSAGLPGLIERVTGGDVRALARALSLVESRAAVTDELLANLHERGGQAVRIGVTGAQGTGKSTLVDRLVGELRREGKRTAVLAIDPTSPFSGGAMLADRVRMLDHCSDPGVYIRSMASRGSLGGLAPTAADALTVLEAARFEAILIETVGVGQAEVDVAGLADHIALVLTPGGGDDMQAMKAGVMEIADVYVINKADLPGADAVERTLRGLLALAPEHAARSIVRTCAKDGVGAGELLERLRAAPPDAARKVGYWRRRLADALARGVAERWVPRLASEQEIAEAAARVAAQECNPYLWVRNLLQSADRDRGDSRRSLSENSAL